MSINGQSATIPFHVIAADAGYLYRAIQASELYISMAERYEVVVDFAPYAGKNIIMKNACDVMADDDYFGTNRVMQFRVGTIVSDGSNNGFLPSISLRPKTESIQVLNSKGREYSSSGVVLLASAYC